LPKTSPMDFKHELDHNSRGKLGILIHVGALERVFSQASKKGCEGLDLIKCLSQYHQPLSIFPASSLDQNKKSI
jgi:hypothetical protein